MRILVAENDVPLANFLCQKPVPGIPHEKFQQREFLRTQIDGVARALDAVAKAIHHQIVHLQAGAYRMAAAA